MYQLVGYVPVSEKQTSSWIPRPSSAVSQKKYATVGSAVVRQGLPKFTFKVIKKETQYLQKILKLVIVSHEACWEVV